MDKPTVNLIFQYLTAWVFAGSWILMIWKHIIPPAGFETFMSGAGVGFIVHLVSQKKTSTEGDSPNVKP